MGNSTKTRQAGSSVVRILAQCAKGSIQEEDILYFKTLCMHICRYVCVYVYVDICIYVGVYICTYVCMYICTHACIYAYV